MSGDRKTDTGWGDLPDLEVLLAEQAKAIEASAETMRRVREVRGKATSPRRQMSVVVDSQGEVLEVTVLTEHWRSLSSRELAELIRTTVNAARAEAGRETADLIKPTMPRGMDVDAVMSGTFDVAGFLEGGGLSEAFGVRRGEAGVPADE